MTNEKRGYYCDYCGLELQWFQVTHDERCVKCGNRVGGEYAGNDHAKVIALEAQAALDAKYKVGLLDLAAEIGGCQCGPEYTGRGLIAPDCAWHQASTPEILQEAGLMGEYQARLDAALATREKGA